MAVKQQNMNILHYNRFMSLNKKHDSASSVLGVFLLFSMASDAEYVCIEALWTLLQGFSKMLDVHLEIWNNCQ
jgi:hypothetical protein